MKNTAVKKIKGFSSAYPNICDLKLLPNIDGTWITIQDDVGTSMTVKLSDLSNFIKTDVLDKIRSEIEQVSFTHYFEYGEYYGEDTRQERIVNFNSVTQIIDKYKEGDE